MTLPTPIADLLGRSSIAVTIGDLTQADCPLVGASERFLTMTGYDRDEVIGRNCRFLQPNDGAGPVRDRMREFIYSDGAADDQFLIPNERKDGTPFINLVYMSKLLRNGAPWLILASQFDVTRATAQSAAAYAETLARDVQALRDVLSPDQIEIMGSYTIMANTTALVARTRLDY
ncbi:PAS domain-containing protein [Sagittula sp. SSi028]|uniref:PAS domain-containing protein n=1 Tax=Sagittula sp. SSi028 TaxID=3400636 RepID=UPI003AF7291D